MQIVSHTQINSGPLHCSCTLNATQVQALFFFCLLLSFYDSLSPTFTLSDGNTPDSLLARSPDQSCTFSQPPYTHSHYTPTSITHTYTHTFFPPPHCYHLCVIGCCLATGPHQVICSQWKLCLQRWFWHITHSGGALCFCYSFISFHCSCHSFHLSFIHFLSCLSVPWF